LHFGEFSSEITEDKSNEKSLRILSKEESVREGEDVAAYGHYDDK